MELLTQLYNYDYYLNLDLRNRLDYVVIHRHCWLQVDFSAAAAAANIINAWIEKNTHGMIKDMLSSDAFSDATRLVLANAVYFKGNHPL